MLFEVLGPLRALHSSGILELNGPKQRLVLAMLIARAGKVVSVEHLVDELWPHGPPASAVHNARSYAARLRRLFAEAEPDVDRITRDGSGYLLRVSTDEVDLLSYEQDARAGVASLDRGDPAAAVEHLRRAYRRWQGPLVDGLVPGPVLSALRAQLQRSHQQLVDNLARAHLATGQPEPATALLEEQLQADPVREQSYELLMHARYQLDGVAGALVVYQEARERLAEALGVDPGENLRSLHRRVLSRDPGLRPGTAAPVDASAKTRATSGSEVAGIASAARGVTGGAGVVPRQLPAGPVGFVGRSEERSTLRDTLLGGDPASRGRPVVTALCGPAGAGKSALALQVAHEVAGHYPDGQLYVDLFGSTPGLRPSPPVEVLARLLHALGMPRSSVPTTIEEAAALFRSLTAGRRVLLVADNAVDTAQVVPLLPGADGCAVIITARRSLSTLDANLRLSLGELPADQARAMLSVHAGNRSLADRDADRIVQLCTRLPLAIRIASARLAARPDLTAAEFARRLADRPLDELEHDGLAVRSVIRAGHDNLCADPGESGQLAAAAFRAVGMLHVPHVSPEAVSAMLDRSDVGAVRAALDRLVDAQLLQPHQDGRFRLHDLVRRVATETAAEHHSGADREQALWRALGCYGGGLLAANQTLRPGTPELLKPPSGLPLREVSFASDAEAKAWIEAELPSCLSVIEQAHQAGGAARGVVPWLGTELWGMLECRCEWRTAYRVANLVLSAATQHGDPALLGVAHQLTGRSEGDLGDHVIAKEHLQRSAVLLRRSGNAAGTALAVNGLGILARIDGDLDTALSCYAEGIALAEQHQLVAVAAVIHCNLGTCYVQLGRLTEAAAVTARSVALHRQHGVLHRLGSGLCNLAIVSCLLGDMAAAARHADEALAVCERTDDQATAREVLVVRSEIRRRLGQDHLAAQDVEEALGLIGSHDHRYVEGPALWQLARILTAAGRREESHRATVLAEAAYASPVSRPDCLLDVLLGRRAVHSAVAVARAAATGIRGQ